MKNLAENNLIRFISITRKKTGIFANFKVKGIKAGTEFSSSIAVDITAAEMDTTQPMEKIIEACGHLAVREAKKADLQFEGLHVI